jgi:ribonuclease HII
MPNFAFEKACPAAPVAGIDEAGRGPLAGPVVAAAVIFDAGRLPRKIARAIDDSKKLAPETRETLFEAIRPYAEIGIGQASVEEIDRYNILKATFLAMYRARVALPRAPAIALVDGNQAPKLGCEVRTIVGGDGISLSIAAASIVAKVTRDRLMTSLAETYPGYGWITNKGYGTAEHRSALLHLGPCPEHRRSFSLLPEDRLIDD